jgi:hypothetical protein
MIISAGICPISAFARVYFATLISTTTGNIYGGLWYAVVIAVVIAVVSTAIGLWKLPETLGRDIRA